MLFKMPYLETAVAFQTLYNVEGSKKVSFHIMSNLVLV